MAQTKPRPRPSMAELIRRRGRSGFVGRRDELGAYRATFGVPPDDERHRFLFCVHGTAGVGKTSLVREMELAAREEGAVTAYLDESVHSVPEVLESIAAQFARQGRPLTRLDKQLATYRQRRHEAESAPPGEPEDPSAAGRALASAGVIGLGMVPVVGPFAAALDVDRLATGADRLRAGLSTRLRSQDDVELVLAPDRVLTPVLTGELADLTERPDDVPWVALFFDTYEQTAPVLDGWLHALMTTETYGALPPQVVVTVAGRRPPDPARWGTFAHVMADLELDAFTESEARGLLAAKGVTDESVVAEVLRLSGRLPVLVSMLAESRPGGPSDVGDPSATAVERFLKWEGDPVRRATALACALPRRLDEDVFAVAAGDTAAGLYDWLCALPFVTPKAAGVGYHDVVRAQMLRLQRSRSPRTWAEHHAALAEAFGRWRAAREAQSETWWALGAEEAYHRLCARRETALSTVLRQVVEACRASVTEGRRLAQAVADAGLDSDDPAVAGWGQRLAAALDNPHEGIRSAMGLLTDGRGPDASCRAAAHALRGRQYRRAGEYARAIGEYERALLLDPEQFDGYWGRGVTHLMTGDHAAALADLRRADALRPGTPGVLRDHAEALRLSGRPEEAVALLDRAHLVDPTDQHVLTTRAVCLHTLGRRDQALADFDRALELDGSYLWALVRRSRLLRGMGDARAWADLDRAAAIAPDSSWIASERGNAYRLAGRYADADRELTRALAIDPGYLSARATRGAVRFDLGRHAEALADLDRVLAADPDYVWARVQRALVHGDMEDVASALADLDHVARNEPGGRSTVIRHARLRHFAGPADDGTTRRDLYDNVPVLALRATYRIDLRLYREALEDAERCLGSEPAYPTAYVPRARALLRTGDPARSLADLRTYGTHRPGGHFRDLEARACLALGRPREALGLLDGVEPASRLRCSALLAAGAAPAALACAALLTARRPSAACHEPALAWTLLRGLPDAAPQWRRLAHRTGSTGTGGLHPALLPVLVSAALGRWQSADVRLGAALAGARPAEPDWQELDDLALALDVLRRAPGVQAGRLAPRLGHVRAARDAVAAHWGRRPDSPDGTDPVGAVG